jgi:hypothetical protein
MGKSWEVGGFGVGILDELWGIFDGKCGRIDVEC